MNILYVDRAYRDANDLRTGEIASALRQEHSVDIELNLDERILGILANKKYDVLITHVPDNEPMQHTHVSLQLQVQDYYRNSLQLLTQIKEKHPNIPILAYTAASNEGSRESWAYSCIFMDRGADAVVFKSGNPQEDVIKIKQTLDYLLTSLPKEIRKRKEQASVPPTIITQDGHTTIDAVVNLRWGLGMMPGMHICQTAEQYDREVVLTYGEKRGSSKGIIGLLMLAAAEGTKLKISVEGTDPKAQELAKIIYAIINAENDKHLKTEMNRWINQTSCPQ